MVLIHLLTHILWTHQSSLCILSIATTVTLARRVSITIKVFCHRRLFSPLLQDLEMILINPTNALVAQSRPHVVGHTSYRLLNNIVGPICVIFIRIGS